jgi:hypothetical protein
MVTRHAARRPSLRRRASQSLGARDFGFLESEMLILA